MTRSSRLPSERFHRRPSTRERTRAALLARTKKGWLERLHEPPPWWEKGKLLDYRTKRWNEVEEGIRSTSPEKYAEAERQLKNHFDYQAEYAIRKYFELRPNTPYSFEEIYTRMLERHYFNFLTAAKENLSGSSYILARMSLAIGPEKRVLESFEQQNLPKASRFTSHPRFGKASSRKISLLGILPPHIPTTPSRPDIVHYLSGIPEPNRTIVMRYFGVGTAPETLASIAKDYGVTGVRIRQRIRRSLEIIRTRTRPPKSKKKIIRRRRNELIRETLEIFMKKGEGSIKMIKSRDLFSLLRLTYPAINYSTFIRLLTQLEREDRIDHIAYGVYTLRPKGRPRKDH
ncbi:MAG: sigma factor-like helix-turn-helix DNA-binding protein [Candidatus Diapherotrites archaeon]|nr:sigma factor-like helix-turn-helix DNA-binding protein [Candidatus Diapherotrites archaeon]MDZ4256159.1 sigma factor-like helix-turn-helix DNA-binding protein [archaeon]